MTITAVTIRIKANALPGANEVSCSLETTGGDAYRLQVRPGDTVIWNFSDIPDYRPAVIFTAFTPSGDPAGQTALELGVFESLEQDGRTISGVVGPAGIGSYEYWIWLLPRKPDLPYRRLACEGGREATIIDRLPPG